jgi:hypothetical protein
VVTESLMFGMASVLLLAQRREFIAAIRRARLRRACDRR